MNIFWLFILVCGISWLLTGVLRRYAISSSLMDIPNQRSSHSIPTPRGGGVSIVITFLAGLFILWVLSLLDSEIFIALSGAGIAIAVIGFIDDHGHIPARWRLLSHFSAASWLVIWLGGLPAFPLFGIYIDLGWVGDILTIIALVWLLNLYNFMDGIDGIAGVEALSTTLIIGLLFLFVLDNQVVFSLSSLLFSAVLGFLVWNVPPAKIFMGDAGSGFVGLMLGGLTLYSMHVDPVMIWVWFILLGYFIVDATFTLFRRLFRGDKVYEAHCSHAYQYASRKYASHLIVAIAVLIINVFWLGPLSYMVALGSMDGVIALLCAYIPLIWLVSYFHAGEKE